MPNTPLKNIDRRKLGLKKRLIFRLFALLLFPFVLLAGEFGLSVVGFGYPTTFLVPFKRDTLVDNYKFAWRFFPKRLARSPQPIVVDSDKPADVKRIVVLGGSAAMGDPEVAYGMPRILEQLLAARFPEHKMEVINAAVTAVNSHVVLSIAQDCARLQPDAWIVYLGNNEVHGPFGAGTIFGSRGTPRWLIRSSLALQRTRIGQLVVGARRAGAQAPQTWGGMEMFLQSQVAADAPALQRVYDSLEANLQGILRVTSRRNATTLLSTVATNLRDSPPFASRHRADLSSSQQAAWQTAYDQGCLAQESELHQEAITAFSAALKLDDQHAELHYRMGWSQLALKQSAEAKQHFEAARDADTLRFRADTQINQRIRAAAKRNERVRLVDAVAHFQDISEDGLPGAEAFHEHVHFNFSGNYELAKLFAAELADHWALSGETEDWISVSECRRRLGFSLWHQLMLNREMKGRLSAAPFIQQCFHDRHLAMLREQARQLTARMNADGAQATLQDFDTLLKANPDDWTLHENYALLLESMGRLDQAVSHFTKVTELLPHRPEGHYQRGRLLNRQKKWADAESPLRTALNVRPDFSRAANSLGIALSQQRKFAESITWFENAIKLQPDYGEASYNWGLVLAEQGDGVGAKAKFKEAVTRDPTYFPAHDRLGKDYVADEKWTSAVPHYRAVASLQPASANAQLNLALLYVKLIHQDPLSEYVPLARTQLQKVLGLDPTNKVARSTLQNLNEFSDARGFSADTPP